MNAEKLACELRKFYLGPNGIKAKLKSTSITALDEFLDNWDNVIEFNRRYYGTKIPKTVICGINPGRNGAGKTGVPFLDFKSLSQLLPNLKKQDSERSAQFFFDIVEHFGPEKFYQSFYVTNISWLGFIKENNNLNYFSLPDKTKKFIYELFVREMSFVKPTTIIALSREVHTTLNELFGDGVNTKNILPHPNYCAFPTNYQKQKKRYIEVLEPFLKLN
jgi:hypothetical protein